MEEDKAKVQRHKDLIALLVMHETGLRTLYRKFAASFPEYHDFWLDLSEQEKAHAETLRKLKYKSEVKESKEYKKRLRNQAVETSLGGLLREIRGAEKIKDPIEAFKVAYHFETSTIEQKYFEIFREPTADLTAALNYLTGETEKHVGNLKEMLDKVLKE